MASAVLFNPIAGFYISLSNASQSAIFLNCLESQNETILDEAIRCLRLVMTCSDSQKKAAHHLKIPYRLIEIISQRNFSENVSLQALYALGSIASSGSEASEGMVNHVLPHLFSILESEEYSPVVEAAARLLRILIKNVVTYLPTVPLLENSKLLRKCLGLIDLSPEISNLCCDLLAIDSSSTNSRMDKNNHLRNAVFDCSHLLCQIPILTLIKMLSSDRIQFKRTALIYVVACLQNENLRLEFIENCVIFKHLLGSVLSSLLDPDQTTEIRLLTVAILTNFYKSDLPLCDFKFVCLKLLPSLCRLCRKQQHAAVRTGAAEIIAYLVDDDSDLQLLAVYTDQLLLNLVEYLKPSSTKQAANSTNLRKSPDRGSKPAQVVLRHPSGSQEGHPFDAILTFLSGFHNTDEEVQLKRSCFLAFSSLTSNEESIRKRVSEMEHGLVVTSVASAITSGDTPLVYGALRLLLSLSRSVQQLRTVFKDHNVWETVLKVLMNNSTPELAAVSSAIIANLSVEFSPNQQSLIRKGLWAYIGTMLSNVDEEVITNACWTLMNITYQASHPTRKSVEEVAPLSVVNDLLKHPNKQIVLCTVGMIRNMLHGFGTKQSCQDTDIATRILRRLRGHAISSSTENSDLDTYKSTGSESPYSQALLLSLCSLLNENPCAPIQEQCFCALVNACASSFGQNMVITNPEILNLIKRGLQHPDTSVESAAVFCVASLARNDEDGGPDAKQYLSAAERQRILTEMNFQKDLKNLMGKEDRQLFERVKTALQYLSGTLM